MSGICIPKSAAAVIRAAIQSGEVNIDKLYEMTDAERNTLFSHYVGKEPGALLNAKYEEARIAAEKTAASDYVSSKDRAAFTEKATNAGFAQKNLLTDAETTKIKSDKLDAQIAKTKDMQKTVSDKMQSATGEDKANLQFKLKNLQEREARLNIRKEDLLNPQTDTLIKKINSVKGLLSNEDYHDLVSAKMGHDVSPAQGKYIVDKANELQALTKANEGKPISAEEVAARANLDSFIRNLDPHPTGDTILANLIEIIKNNYIISVKTPLKTAWSDAVLNPMRAIETRISHLSFSGTDRALAKQMHAEDLAFTKKTQFSRTSMRDNLDVGSTLGSHTLGNTYGLKDAVMEAMHNETFTDPAKVAAGTSLLSKSESVIAAGARGSHFLAIQVEHNWLFQKIYSSAFYDTLNMEAMDNAKVEGLKGDAARARGREIMTDANFPEPKTEAGKALRARAQYVAMRTLNVDKTIASDISVGVKNGINGAMKEATGMDIPLGTLAEPFAMIGTNLTQHSIEMNPVVGGGEAAWDMVRGKMKMSENNPMATRYEGAAQYQKGIQKLIGVVGSVGMAAYLTSKLTSKDFRQDNYGNSFVNIGGVWINTEFFGRLSSNITAMMTLKQGKGIEASAEDSLLLPFKNTPLGSKVFGVLDTMTGKNGITKTLSGIPSSFLPAILTDLSNTRPIDRLFFGASGLETDTQYKADTVAKTQKAAATRKANLPKAKY